MPAPPFPAPRPTVFTAGRTTMDPAPPEATEVAVTAGRIVAVGGGNKNWAAITPGKTANFTVLAQDTYEVAPEQLGATPILGTVSEGRWFPGPDPL